MASLKFTIEAKEGQFEDVLAIQAYDTVEQASQAAITAAGQIVKIQGRADIAAAGFGPKWQNTFRVDVFPKTGASVNAAAFIHHKIGYAGIFEEGGEIQGKPLLWIPLTGTPKKIGRYRFSAYNYRLKYGRDSLQLVKRTGKAPLLFGKKPSGMRRALVRRLKGLRKDVGDQRVPLFAGVDRVNIRKRFHIRNIVESAAARLPELFTAHFDPGD